MGSVNGQPPPTASSGATTAYQTMVTAQQQYVTDQQKVASGQLPASQLTTDWQTYLTAAEAWMTAQGGGAPSVLPPNEPGVSASGVSGLADAYLAPSSSGGSMPSSASALSFDSRFVVPPSPSASTGSVTSSGSVASSGSLPSVSGASGGSGVMSVLGGPATLGPGFPSDMDPYRSAIIAASQATGVSANLIAAIVATENKGITNAVNPMTVDGAGSDMTQNMILGAQTLVKYAQQLEPKYGDNLGVFLRAYNSGPNANINYADYNNLQGANGQSYYVPQVTTDLQIIQSGQGNVNFLGGAPVAG